MPSSVIKKFDYDERHHILTIFFVSGGIYKYMDVPSPVVKRFKVAFSKGVFFSRYIRGRYKFKKMQNKVKAT